MSAFSVCLWPDHHRFSALDFMYSISLEIRLLILTYARGAVRAERKTITLWLVFRGDLAGQWEFVPPAIKEEQAWLLKEFEVKFKKSTKTHYPCLNYGEEQAKNQRMWIATQNSPILAYVSLFSIFLEELNAVFGEWVSDFANIFLVPF